MTAHESVLLKESIAGLEIKSNGIYVDGTFGRGGHSHSILEKLGPEGHLFAIDKDLEAVTFSKTRFVGDPRFTMIHGSFAEIDEYARQFSIKGKIDGILLDLGVSSPQLDDSHRGFSFMQSGPLDMRMNTEQKEDAAHFIQYASAEEMAIIFREYGEERYAGRIARAIVEARQKSPIHTTLELAEIVKAANPKWEKHKHPATRVFQALRIHVNQELNELKLFLKSCLDVLAVGGRIAIISFHSLEDRIVKQFMRDQEKGMDIPLEVPVRDSELKTNFKRIGKAIKPNEQEVRDNVRARSAVLRIGEKTA